MTVDPHAETGFLHVTTRGEFSLEEAQRTFLEMLDAVAQHNAARVLVDGREISGEPETIERFYFGEFAAKEAYRLVVERRVSFTPKFAYILREPVLDPRRLGETVAVNRGMHIKVFEHADEALEWLAVASERQARAQGQRPD